MPPYCDSPVQSVGRRDRAWRHRRACASSACTCRCPPGSVTVGGAGDARGRRVRVEREHRQQPVDRGLRAGVVVDRAVGGDAVEGDAGGRVVRRLAGRVRAEEPRGRDPGEPVTRPAASATRTATAPASRRRRRSGCASTRVGSRPLSGPPEVSSHGSKVKESRGRGPRQRPVAESRRRAGQRGRHLRGPGVPVRAGQRPRQHAAERPACARRRRTSRRCRRSARGAPAGPRGPAAADVGREPEHRLGGGVGPVGDEPRGVRRPSMFMCSPYVSSTCGRTREIARSRRRLRKRANAGSCAEGRVALAERPDGPGQPVGRVAVRGVRCSSGSRWGSACRRAASRAPRCRRSGRSRSAGRSGRAASRRRAPARGVAGLLPVAQVDDRRAGHVVGVERALPVGVVAAS